MTSFNEKIRSHKPGFTLIELLVVVAIIAVLISILLPSVSAARERARQVVCASNLKQVSMAFMAYNNDYNYMPKCSYGGIPWYWQQQCAIYYSGRPWDFTGKTDYPLLRCPSLPSPAIVNDNRGVYGNGGMSYGYNMNVGNYKALWTSGIPVNSMTHPETTFALMDGRSPNLSWYDTATNYILYKHTEGLCILFGDYHVDYRKKYVSDPFIPQAWVP